MKILICGNKSRTAELKSLLDAEEHEITIAPEASDELIMSKEDCDLFFDLNADDNPERIRPFMQVAYKPVILSAVKRQVAEMMHHIGNPETTAGIFGINALPGFMKRGMLEISMFGDSNESYNLLKGMLEEKLKLNFQRVEDRTGMVTPRVIMMIINEACFTLQEGTANKKDIDLSLKLGTNYPYGPFEWADMIGIRDVYETLSAIYKDTGDERYKICSLLKTHYLKGEPFMQ